VAAVGSFYRYHIQRGAELKNPVLYEQISDRFSRFKRFLVHLGHGKTNKRNLKLKEPERRLKTVKDADFARFFSSTENLQFRCILSRRNHASILSLILAYFLGHVSHGIAAWLKLTKPGWFKDELEVKEEDLSRLMAGSLFARG